MCGMKWWDRELSPDQIDRYLMGFGPNLQIKFNIISGQV